MCCVFFQAEDGILGLVRSRGLGDVYKRQALNVDLTGQPTDFKLSELPVKIGDSGNLEVMGIAIPGVSLPADTLQQLRDLGVSQLAVNASTEALNLAVDGKALPSIRSVSYTHLTLPTSDLV